MTAGRTSISTNKDWGTPPLYVTPVRSVLGKIWLDPCSNRHSIVGAEIEYTLPSRDGLACSWNYPTIYVNPPYGADRERHTTIRHWLCKCALAHAEFHSEILALVPVATNTRHWKLHVFGVASAVAFLYDTRLKFLVNGKEGGKGAPMACAMIYWGMKVVLFGKIFTPFGAVVDLRGLQGRQIGKSIN